MHHTPILASIFIIVNGQWLLFSYQFMHFSSFLIFDGLCRNVGQRDDGSVPVFVRDFLPGVGSRGNLIYRVNFR
jgi:hypothetical protein